MQKEKKNQIEHAIKVATRERRDGVSSRALSDDSA